MILALLVVLLLAVVTSAAGIGLVVAPFVRGVDLAERRGFSTTVAALVALEALASSHRVLLLPALVLSWGAPAVLSLLDPSQGAVGGRTGAHER